MANGFDGELQGEAIAARPEAGDDAGSQIGQIGMMAKSFPLMNIGQVNFNERDRNCGKRIADRDTCMCVGSRIDDDEGNFTIAG